MWEEGKVVTCVLREDVVCVYEGGRGEEGEGGGGGERGGKGNEEGGQECLC